MKTIIIGKIYDPILDCGHAGMNIETCYRGKLQIYHAELQQELREYEDKRVIISIETMEDFE